MDFAEVLMKYGWQLCLVAFIGCVLVGLIKTPINKAVIKKLDAKCATEDARKRANTIYDSLVYLGNYAVALLLSFLYQLIFKQLTTFGALAGYSLKVWLLQNTFYGIWKKLGLKGLLSAIGKGLRKWLIKMADKNKDGKVSVLEAIGTVNDVKTNGEIDSSKLFNKVKQTPPTADVINSIYDESGVDMKTEDEAKHEIKKNVIDLTESFKSSNIKF